MEEIRVLDKLSHTLGNSCSHCLLHFAVLEKTRPATIELILGKFDVGNQLLGLIAKLNLLFLGVDVALRDAFR